MRAAAIGSLEGDVADRQGGRRGDRADDVGVVLLVRRQDGHHDLHVVLVALGEERPDGPVGQAGGQDGRLGRARLALDEAAGDLARGVHALLEVHRQGEEVEARARVRPVGRPQHHGVAVADGHRAAGEPGETPGFDGQRTSADLGRECDWHQSSICGGRGPLAPGRTRAMWQRGASRRVLA